MSLRNVVIKKPGAVLIINCITFKEEFKLENRPASRHDVDRLRTMFYLMNFSVQILNDPYFEDIENKLNEVAQQDFTDFGSLVIVFMSHGGADDNQNKSLQEISKYMVIEACKGVLDPNAIYDSKSSFLKSVPNLIGILMSSFEGYVSFMYKEGSAFISAFCKVLSDYCKTGEDLPFWDVLCRIKDEFEDNDQQCPMVVNYKGSDNFTLHTYLEH